MNARPFIVGLGGTTRVGSSTELALRASLAAAEAAGARTELFAGESLLLPPYGPSMEPMSPAAGRLIDAIRRCDGLIIASPGYHGSISGLVKNALDYTEDLRTDSRVYLDGRAVGCIATAMGWQAAGSTLNALRSIVHALRGWPTPMGATINTSTPQFDASGACTDPSAALQLRLVGEQVVEFAQMMRLTHAADACTA
jgi:FMN reductase